MATQKKETAQHREQFQHLILQNPNYFGNLTEAGVKTAQKAVLSIVGNTTYEDLKCISYHPETAKLEATVQLKQTSGYGGTYCTGGTREYVRFYVDYDRNGTWVDEGLVSFDSYSLGFTEDLCYSVNVFINPKKRKCCKSGAVLPRVRAILSWNAAPPANQPNWLPVWGTRKEANIQIEPRHDIFCLITDFLPKFEIDPSKFEKLIEEVGPKIPIPEPDPAPFQELSLLEVKQLYKGKVEENRFAAPTVQKALMANNLSIFEQSAVSVVNFPAIADFVLKTKFNTSFEEVTCVSLNKDASILNATVVVKKANGYSGTLCQSGSREYVAFYMDFGTGWHYMGNSSVEVHDIANMPADGLHYNVFRKVNLNAHQKEWCKAGKAKVRAILSWNVAPPPFQPDYIAPWGDREDSYVEIKPLPKDVTPGLTKLSLDTLGSMPVELINVAGYATGENFVGMKAQDSPFDGVTRFNGVVLFAPIFPLKYRILIQEPDSAIPNPQVNNVKIRRSGIPGEITLVPDSDGWMTYYNDSVEDFLGSYSPSKEGRHYVTIEVKNALTNVQYTSSGAVPFMVDKTAPVVDIEITSGGGNCGKFTVGDTIQGTFSLTDAHPHSLSLSVTPGDEANGARPTIDGSGGFSGLSYPLTLSGTGTSGTWTLETKGMNPCGYNVRIDGYDRTIINSSSIGHHAPDIEGFCLD
ncbi:MAG: hypothetical protein H6577_24150 [Lewinellaceae bacterium]|nr:hypothetical protein [Saprospiraceae bacterium]MCB9341228.1 hypothetical protein [Lewinellaceae bacterium]